MKKLIKRIKALIQRIFKWFSSPAQPPSPVSSRSSSTLIPTASLKCKSGLVLVCSQCAKERGGSTASDDLQNWLKSRLKFEGLWGEFRVVSTSCLGVCPKAHVTVVTVSDGDGGKSQCLIVDPKSDRELLYAHIKQM
ncbi:MAG: (2Fe-2S) ferredoxin domain-containing protein [Desmonostoc vinosum HA7617-LM4]|jgi:hypothetical protein|nr:(2Fe-2S) ferredoxin domain-containing protein [Desmonostoc vinosum HA7617-LM4]